LNKEYVILGILALLIFSLDIVMPLGVADVLLYVLLIIKGWRLNNPIEINILEAIVIFLIEVGSMLSSPRVELWIVFVNRLYSILVVTVLVTTFCKLKETKGNLTEEIDLKSNALKDITHSENKLRATADPFSIGHTQINDQGIIEPINPAVKKYLNIPLKKLLEKIFRFL
jgi:PAS domain-containing protein